MVSGPPTRREGSGKIARRCLFVSALSCVAACAGMLDLPDDPRLAEPEPAAAPEQPDVAMQPPPLDPSQNEPPATNPPVPTPGEDVGVDETPLEPSEQMTSSGDGQPPPPVATVDAGVEAPPEPPPDAAPAEVCPTGATLGPNSRCYATLDDVLTWDDARDECQSIDDGWDLAVIRDAAANDFVSTLMNVEAWLGGTDAEVEGRWLWITDDQPFWNGNGENGAPVGGAFEAWNSDEPNGAGPSDCMRLVAGRGTWADLQCTFERPAVCEGPTL